MSLHRCVTSVGRRTPQQALCGATYLAAVGTQLFHDVVNCMLAAAVEVTLPDSALLRVEGSAFHELVAERGRAHSSVRQRRPDELRVRRRRVASLVGGVLIVCRTGCNQPDGGQKKQHRRCSSGQRSRVLMHQGAPSWFNPLDRCSSDSGIYLRGAACHTTHQVPDFPALRTDLVRPAGLDRFRHRPLRRPRDHLRLKIPRYHLRVRPMRGRHRRTRMFRLRHDGLLSHRTPLRPAARHRR